MVNITNQDQTVDYTVTPTYNGCTGSPFTVTFTVHPEPVGVPDATPVTCSNVIPDYNKRQPSGILT